MSRRTSEASKAVAEAWKNEQQLVKEGKGTRDWTREQQQSIIEKGKAYDDNGKAFEGHHMKSAEMFPDYQGDSGNIQFLSRTEHFAAHGGSFQNATNGYYDFLTGETFDFGTSTYSPCTVIDLSEPVYVVVVSAEDETPCEIHDFEVDDSNEMNHSNGENNVISEEPDLLLNATKKTSIWGKIGKGFVTAVDKVKAFSYEHPILTTIIGTIVSVAASESVNRVSNKASGSYEIYNNEYANASDQVNSRQPNILSDEENSQDSNDQISDTENTGTPKSPHIRKGHTHHYWVKGDDGEFRLEERWLNDTYVNGNKENDE